jgi:hypothetical protein
MRGYEAVTSDDRVVGKVLYLRHGFLIVESGRVRKTRHPVPREFVHVVDEAAKAFVTVPRRILTEAPKADKDGEFDPAVAARHFGLAADRDAITAGRPAPGHRRAEIRKRMRPGYPDEHQRSFTALFGDRRIDDRRVGVD